MIENVNRLIKEKGMTKDQLAKKIGTSRVNLHRILTGNPTLSNLEKIAAGLGVELWQLFTGSGENIVGAVYYKNEVYKIQSKQDILNLLKVIDQ